MKKSDVISKVAQKTGISKADVQITVEALLRSVQNAVSEGEKVHFRGFGCFLAKRKGKKIARNISQNTAIIIEEHYVPSFRPAKSFITKTKELLISVDPQDGAAD